MKSLGLSLWLLSMLLCVGAAVAQNEEPAGGASDGGGLGFCSSDGCVTLAQAGFRVPQQYVHGNSYMIPNALREAVSNFIYRLPISGSWKSELTTSVLGRDGTNGSSPTFYRVATADTTEIITQYRRIVRSRRPDLNIDTATVYAISNETRTYLLDAFFQLPLEGQVLILIHEALVRRAVGYDGISDDDMLRILQMDGYLADISKALKEDRSVHSVDLVPFFIAATQRGWMGYENSLELSIIFHIAQRRGRPMTWSELCGTSYLPTPGGGKKRCNFSENEAALQNIDPRLVAIFHADWMSAENESSRRSYLLGSEYRSIRAEYNSICQSLGRDDYVFVPARVVLTRQNPWGGRARVPWNRPIPEGLIHCAREGRNYRVKADELIGIGVHTGRD